MSRILHKPTRKIAKARKCENAKCDDGLGLGNRLIMYALLSVIVFGMAAGVRAVPAPGDSVQPFSLARVGGGTTDWKPGRVTVFSFCAFWCDTWKAQSKRLGACKKALGALPVDFVTVSVDGRWSEVCDGKIAGLVLLDLKSTLTRRLGINRVPCTLVVDRGGVVRYAAEGIVREEAVKSAVCECAGGETAVKTGVVYLTFDDFPYSSTAESSTPTGPDEKLLDVLQTSNVRATFFCVCCRLDQCRSLIERAVKEGHSLQVHSWDHQASDPRIETCVQAIKKLTGSAPRLYRPPGSEKCLPIEGPGLPTLSVVDPYDYTRPGKEELKRRILLAVKPNCVVLLHAGVSETVDVLAAVIGSLRQRGFSFGVLR